MYKNIGGKIKGLAKFFCTLGIIFSILIALLLVGLGMMNGDTTTLIVCAIGGVVYAFLGSLIAWLSTIMLYAFGQQVEMQEKSAVLLEKILNKLNAAPQPAPQPVAPPAPKPIPPMPKYEAPKPVAPPAPQPVEPVLPKVEAPKPTCPKCGATVAEGSAFCTSCGNKM